MPWVRRRGKSGKWERRRKGKQGRKGDARTSCDLDLDARTSEGFEGKRNVWDADTVVGGDDVGYDYNDDNDNDNDNDNNDDDGRWKHIPFLWRITRFR